jgi:hypothetical protein
MFKHMSTCPDNQAVHDAIARGMGDFSKIWKKTKSLMGKFYLFRLGR